MAKVLFPLEIDEYGFPPVSYESIHATSVGPNLFRLDNSPFFAPNVAYHDIVTTTSGEVDAQHVFAEVVTSSPFTSISIIILDGTMRPKIKKLIHNRDCIVEYGEFGSLQMFAISLPPGVYSVVKPTLYRWCDEESVSVAELALGE